MSEESSGATAEGFASLSRTGIVLDAWFPDPKVTPAGGKPAHVATLNGTAVTWRHMIAILENHQREDGTVAIPAVLHPWGAPPVLRVGQAA